MNIVKIIFAIIFFLCSFFSFNSGCEKEFSKGYGDYRDIGRVTDNDATKYIAWGFGIAFLFGGLWLLSRINKGQPKDKIKYPIIKVAFDESFQTNIVKEKIFYANKIKVNLTDPIETPNYFDSDEIFKKLFSIEPVKLFYKMPQMEIIEIEANINKGYYHCQITISEIEDYYKINIENLREHSDDMILKVGEKFQNLFIKKYDNKENRDMFFKKYVKAANES